MQFNTTRGFVVVLVKFNVNIILKCLLMVGPFVLVTIAVKQTSPNSMTWYKTGLHCAHGFCGSGVSKGRSGEEPVLIHKVWGLSWKTQQLGGRV